MATNNTIAMGVANLPEKTPSVEEFIEMGRSDEITYQNFSILVNYIEEDSEIQYSQDNIIYDYMNELLERAEEIELTDDDYVKYRYKPKLLSYEVYGTTELFFVILALNGMCSIKDFNKRKIKMLHQSDMLDLLNQIYSAEADYIKYNRKHLNHTATQK